MVGPGGRGGTAIYGLYRYRCEGYGFQAVYSRIGYINSAELALVKVKGSRLSAAHPHPEIPTVPPPPPPRDCRSQKCPF